MVAKRTAIRKLQMRDTGSHNGFPVLAAAQTTLRLSDKGTDLVSALYTGLQRIRLLLGVSNDTLS